MSDLSEITDAAFESEVIKQSVKTIVAFWAPWSGTWRYTEPVFEKVAGEAAGIRALRMNVDDHPQVATNYGVKTLPAFLVFEGGKVTSSLFGAASRTEIRQLFGL